LFKVVFESLASSLQEVFDLLDDFIYLYKSKVNIKTNFSVIKVKRRTRWICSFRNRKTTESWAM